MKVIDLLNKIANGEEVPKKIKYITTNYIYDSDNQIYYKENYQDIGNYGDLLMELSSHKGIVALNDEIEIIEDTTINIQDLFNERVEQNKRIEELANINEKLSLALESAENKLNLISQYIRSLPTFHIGYEKDKDDIEKTMYASEFNFVDEIISLLENGGK